MNIIFRKKSLVVASLLSGLAGGPALAQIPQPLACSTTSYLFQNDATDVYELDLTTGKSARKTTDGIPGIATSTSNTGGVKKLNAIGYNQVDNYIWAQLYGTTQVARIGKDPNGNYLGQTLAVSGLPTPNGNSNNFVVGDVSPSGKMYLTLGGSNANTTIYVIDLTASTSALTANTLTTSQTFITDWAVSPIDNNLYAISSNVTGNAAPAAPVLYRFLTADRSNSDGTTTVAGTRENLGQPAGITTDKNGGNNTYNFGSAFMDVTGSFYGVLNSTGAIYRIDNPQTLPASPTATPTATYVATPNLTASNTDGARCSSAKVERLPLPVTLTAFTATATTSRSVQLSWTTANEQNNHFFEVQRSVDGQVFATVGQVAGHQTTTQASAYSFADTTPGAGTTHYYRLRQVDLNGSFSYSPVRSVALAAGAAVWQVAVAPNPTSAAALRVQVLAEASAPASATLEVRNLLGQCVWRQAVTLQSGSNELTLNTTLASGLYWLGLTSADAPTTKGVKVWLE